MSEATAIQPTPHGSGTPIVELVKADLEARAVVGEKKYGERLKVDNGRDVLTDLYQEILDAACYCRQEIEERSMATTESDKRFAAEVTRVRSIARECHAMLGNLAASPTPSVLVIREVQSKLRMI